MADTKAPPAVLASCMAVGVSIGFALWCCAAAADEKRASAPAPALAEASQHLPSKPGVQEVSHSARPAAALTAPPQDEFDVEVEVQQVELFEEVLATLPEQGSDSLQRLPGALRDYRKALENGLPGRGKELRAVSVALEAALCATEDEDGLSVSFRLGQEPGAFKELVVALDGLLGTKAS